MFNRIQTLADQSCIQSKHAGAYFDFYWAAFLVYIGNVIGQSISFILARYYFRAPIQRCISSRWKRFDLIDMAIRKEGATLVFVLRLNPCVPYNILNYALGLTSISLFEYSWSSAISILPYVVSFVYIGCLSSNVMELVEGGWAEHGAMLPWVVVSAVIVTASLVYGYWFTKRALTDALEEAMTPRTDCETELSRLGGPALYVDNEAHGAINTV
jgi:uncharacterized membrane protein YdjX (TVP38/TMEM64 family)